MAHGISETTRLGRWLHWIFEASLLLKGLFAAAETLSGLALLGLPGNAVLRFAEWLTQRELTEDPHDAIATALLNAAQQFSIQTQSFYGFYFTSHGALKLVVVILLMRGVLWAYPAALALLSAFVVYQLYLWTHHHAISMLLLSALDILVIALTWREWHARFGLALRAPPK
ncbi:DUF2127 domain-containing protein [Thioclava sp. BHET1]|uniref:DUF2127 domain-containing protein n=1 Tax=Thioclava dalianensis TaxID=1185766 RepID=UPI00068E400A|nr:DUF2127 domain-containing protein [Thioclava dalianensis]TMV90354.1 DUF2127 domain-containing protein [Thioclava sp. BHET1]SFM73333.1 Uncharacterized membrane protein [Thioclava dalianensis]